VRNSFKYLGVGLHALRFSLDNNILRILLRLWGHGLLLGPTTGLLGSGLAGSAVLVSLGLALTRSGRLLGRSARLLGRRGGSGISNRFAGIESVQLGFEGNLDLVDLLAAAISVAALGDRCSLSRVSFRVLCISREIQATYTVVGCPVGRFHGTEEVEELVDVSTVRVQECSMDIQLDVQSSLQDCPCQSTWLCCHCPT